ncbi:MAG TPA: protein kinase, partial [Ktedonosporobacter sp.]|nr:protein kinase [Ktedonosporobacter sp.]
MHGEPSPHYGHYRLLRQIGIGRFSQVYLAEHRYLGSQVALKLVPLDLSPERGQRFLEEARTLQNLQHPHIVRVLDFGMQEQTAFLVMDYAARGTLRTRHADGLPVPLATVVSYVQQVASALRFLHERQVIHRDLKPENLLLDQDEHLLLGDFGLAVVLSHTSEYVPAAVEGSLGYMAPEQFHGKPRFASDQYALGILVYEWLTGSRPFHGEFAQLCHAHLYLSPPLLSQRLPQVSPLVEVVVRTTLAKHPAQRFADVAAFASAFSLAAAGRDVSHLLPTNAPAPSLLSDSQGSRPSHFQIPLLLTPLIGRDGARACLALRLLQPEVRLLTLTGPGGIGKTSLALAVASHELREAFADGICFVDLSAIHDPHLVLPAIAEALEQQTGHRPIFELVRDFLRDKHFLLVLDNFEQVVRAAPQVTDLLRGCPHLKLLVTSREILHVQDEYEFAVSPLELPTLDQGAGKATLGRNDAVVLFVQRAQESLPDFQLTEENAASIAEICLRLDGLPLALELAAARLKLLTPAQLLTRLSRSLDVLTRGRRDAPARQQTLRTTIAWSYDLLSGSEQVLFRRLSVFVGGCSLEAIEDLYRLLGDDPGTVLDGVSSLLDKSLVRPLEQTREGLRIGFLETIRAFGLECVQEANEWPRVQQAHARAYLEWARRGCQELFGPEQLLWMRAFLREMGNLRAAMRVLLDQPEPGMALRLGGALGPLWLFLGLSNQRLSLVEGTDYLQQALAASKGRATGSRARALVLYGGLLAWLGETEQGEQACREGVALFRQLADPQGVIHGLWMLYLPLSARCELLAAYQTAQEAVALARENQEMCSWWGAAWTLGYSLFNVCNIAVSDGHYAEGRAAAQEAVRLCERAGDRFFSTWAALYLAEILLLQGQGAEARTRLEQSRKACRALEMRAQEAEALCFLGRLSLGEGLIEQAEQFLSESVQLAKEVDDTQAVVWSLLAQARVHMARQQWSSAQALQEAGLRLALIRHDR